MSTSKAAYTAKDITILEGLEPVRKRPSMYIGGVDVKGLHHLVWEIVDNAVDEYLNGFGNALTVILHKDQKSITVTDNGRGIPVDLHPQHKKPALELILTTLHSGAKFGEGTNYLHSGGLHGVGSSVVNALSRRMVVTVKRDGAEWEQEFSQGRAVSKLKKLKAARGHGTSVFFEPDEEIFKSTKLSAETIRGRLEDMGYIHSGLKITFCDEAEGVIHDLTHEGGLPAYLGQLIKETGKPPVGDLMFTLQRDGEDRLDVAFCWTEATNDSIRSYVNGIRTPAGGTHEAGVRNAIVKAVRNYMATHNIKVKGLTITAEDIREGVVGILSVFCREPMFQGQTKDRLNNPEMTASVESYVRPALEAWLNTNMTAADQIVGRIVLAAKARAASREVAAEIKRKAIGTRRVNLPGKLADCKATSLAESELFIVEGDSAGGSAKQGRNPRTQAVLPLRGKVLNCEGIALPKVLANQELQNLVLAIGTGVGAQFDLSKLRYGKVILLMDADADGHHITTLLLAFFFRHMPELIRKGHVYIAQPPLYRIDHGKETHWAKDDAHRDEILRGLPKNARPDITRFKGLGEMPPKVLAETALTKKQRTLLKVQLDSLLEADQTFSALLGKDPSARYQRIVEATALPSLSELDI